MRFSIVPNETFGDGARYQKRLTASCEAMIPSILGDGSTAMQKHEAGGQSETAVGNGTGIAGLEGQDDREHIAGNQRPNAEEGGTRVV